MKIGGVQVTTCEEILVLPRPEQDIVIKAKAATNMDDFDKLVPEPKPPGIRTREGFKPDPKDKSYLQLKETYEEQKLNYLVIQSLVPSEIDWEKVILDDPSTWSEWRTEFKGAGLSDIEVNRILMCVMGANALDESKLEAARELFVRGRALDEESSGQEDEPQSTQSGEPASE